jgi:hypothetical protein
MFSTINSVKEYTSYDVSLELIKRAQAIIEIFIGKDEIDVQNVSDLLVLDKMTAYQSAYMLENEDVVYKQIAATSVGSGDSVQNYNTQMHAPWIAPLSVLASRGLTFNRPRSILTGKIIQKAPLYEWMRY